MVDARIQAAKRYLQGKKAQEYPMTSKHVRIVPKSLMICAIDMPPSAIARIFSLASFVSMNLFGVAFSVYGFALRDCSCSCVNTFLAMLFILLICTIPPPSCLSTADSQHLCPLPWFFAISRVHNLGPSQFRVSILRGTVYGTNQKMSPDVAKCRETPNPLCAIM